MKTINGLSAIARPATPVVLTIGNFDGLHVGHRSLVTQVIESARKIGALSTVISFDPHPTRILRPDSPSSRLFSVHDLIAQLGAMGLDQVIIEPFTRELAQMSAENFLKYLMEHLVIAKIFIGHDFKFGHDREGSEADLQTWAKKFGFSLTAVSPFKLQDQIVSSSQIRKYLSAGDVESAARLLARPYYVEGVVASGDGRGHQIGFATANLDCSSEIIPEPGVYITRFVVRGQKMNAISNVGYKPTFHERGPLTVETHVLDQKQEFLGASACLEFLKRVRAEMKFANPEALIRQIRRDVALARDYFG